MVVSIKKLLYIGSSYSSTWMTDCLQAYVASHPGQLSLTIALSTS